MDLKKRESMCTSFAQRPPKSSQAICSYIVVSLGSPTQSTFLSGALHDEAAGCWWALEKLHWTFELVKRGKNQEDIIKKRIMHSSHSRVENGPLHRASAVNSLTMIKHKADYNPPWEHQLFCFALFLKLLFEFCDLTHAGKTLQCINNILDIWFQAGCSYPTFVQRPPKNGVINKDSRYPTIWTIMTLKLMESIRRQCAATETTKYPINFQAPKAMSIKCGDLNFEAN